MRNQYDIEAQMRQVQSLMDKGKTVKQIAAKMEISLSTVHNRKVQLAKSATAGVIVSESIQSRVNGQIDVMGQLSKLNDTVWEILNAAVVQEDKIDAAKEIRGQLKLCADLTKTLYDIEMVQAFQAAVLEALEEAHPDLRKEAIRLINQKKEMMGVSML